MRPGGLGSFSVLFLWSNRFYSIFHFSFDVLHFWAGSPLCSLFVVVVVLRCGLTTAKKGSRLPGLYVSHPPGPESGPGGAAFEREGLLCLSDRKPLGLASTLSFLPPNVARHPPRELRVGRVAVHHATLVP